jgi:hypothetical protein
MTDSTTSSVATSGGDTKPVRRRFLAGAAAATAGAGSLGFPMISVAQSPVVLKMQGAWGPNEIFTEMAQQYVTRVNEMSGGRLRLEYLPTGAVVKTFEIMDAVSKGVLDAGHHVSGYWYGKSKVASLFGTGPVSGATPDIGLTWIYQGGGQQLGHGEGTQGPLHRHQQQRSAGPPGKPAGQAAAPEQAGPEQHQQGHTHHEGIEPVEPLQEHLQVHLTPRQQPAVAKRPVGAGQSGLHHPRGTADAHQGHEGHHQMGREQSEPMEQCRVQREIGCWVRRHGGAPVGTARWIQLEIRRHGQGRLGSADKLASLFSNRDLQSRTSQR